MPQDISHKGARGLLAQISQERAKGSPFGALIFHVQQTLGRPGANMFVDRSRRNNRQAATVNETTQSDTEEPI